MPPADATRGGIAPQGRLGRRPVGSRVRRPTSHPDHTAVRPGAVRATSRRPAGGTAIVGRNAKASANAVTGMDTALDTGTGRVTGLEAVAPPARRGPGSILLATVRLMSTRAVQQDRPVRVQAGPAGPAARRRPAPVRRVDLRAGTAGRVPGRCARVAQPSPTALGVLYRAGPSRRAAPDRRRSGRRRGRSRRPRLRSRLTSPRLGGGSSAWPGRRPRPSAGAGRPETPNGPQAATAALRPGASPWPIAAAAPHGRPG